MVAHVSLAVSANKLINNQRIVNNYEINAINELWHLFVLLPSTKFSIRKSLVSTGDQDIKDIRNYIHLDLFFEKKELFTFYYFASYLK